MTRRRTLGSSSRLHRHGRQHRRHLRRLIALRSPRTLRRRPRRPLLPSARPRQSALPNALGRAPPAGRPESLLLLVIGKFQALFSLAIFAEWLFYALTASTIFVFRRREPSQSAPTASGDTPSFQRSSSSPPQCFSSSHSTISPATPSSEQRVILLRSPHPLLVPAQAQTAIASRSVN